MNVRILRFLLAAMFALGPAAAAQGKAAPPASLRLYVLDCGRLDIPDVAPYQLKKEEMGTTVMSVPCFLVAHPKGSLMWDVGAVPDTAIPAGGTGRLRGYGSSAKRLQTQLDAIGYAPSDITYLALSHFHWDHVGNANMFAQSTWLVRKLERDTMFADPPSPRTEPANYSLLKNAKTVLLTNPDYDVFGDGTVVIKSAPGHSPDHQLLFVRLAKTGPVVLSGDLYHYPEERERKRVPTTDFNPQQTASSRSAIEGFIAQTHAQLWIQHDFTATEKLKKAPEFYE
jgi:glyoxylase-like metal-dependent hydrolase (beta-lactamase superfamily II)